MRFLIADDLGSIDILSGYSWTWSKYTLSTYHVLNPGTIVLHIVPYNNGTGHLTVEINLENPLDYVITAPQFWYGNAYTSRFGERFSDMFGWAKNPQTRYWFDIYQQTDKTYVRIRDALNLSNVFNYQMIKTPYLYVHPCKHYVNLNNVDWNNTDYSKSLFEYGYILLMHPDYAGYGYIVGAKTYSASELFERISSNSLTVQTGFGSIDDVYGMFWDDVTQRLFTVFKENSSANGKAVFYETPDSSMFDSYPIRIDFVVDFEIPSGSWAEKKYLFRKDGIYYLIVGESQDGSLGSRPYTGNMRIFKYYDAYEEPSSELFNVQLEKIGAKEGSLDPIEVRANVRTNANLPAQGVSVKFEIVGVTDPVSEDDGRLSISSSGPFDDVIVQSVSDIYGIARCWYLPPSDMGALEIKTETIRATVV